MCVEPASAVSNHWTACTQVTPSWDEDKLVLTYEPKEADKGKAQKHIREVTGDDLVMVSHARRHWGPMILHRKQGQHYKIYGMRTFPRRSL